MKYEMFKGDGGKWYWRFIADSGKELFRSSGGYESKADANNSLRRAKQSSGATVFEEKDDGTWFVQLM